MKLSLNSYTKRDTDIIKGFAILCIVFHNYFHWLAPSPGENEFDFSPSRVHNFFDLLGQQPGEFVNILFSYFGHYGVQLFVMVSGLGLTLSMLRREQGWGEFVINRLKKLYPLLITGVVVCLLGCLVMNGRLFNQGEWREIGYKFLFIHTLIPNSGLSINGPWWFFGLIFQLYLLFPLLFRCIKKWRWKAFLVVLAVSYGLIFLFREYLNLHHGTILMQNAPGHLPEFCFGMMLAFNKDERIHWLWLLLALVLFVWGNFAPGFYPFTFLSLCVITVFVTQAWKAKNGKWKKVFRYPLSVLHYFGGISMMLFIVHGYFRVPVLKWANTMTSAWGHLASGLLFFLLVWGIALAAKPLYTFLVSLLDRIHLRENRLTRIISNVCAVTLGLFFAFVFGYFIYQNLNKFDEPLVFTGESNTEGTIQTDMVYATFVNVPLEQRYSALSVKGSVDVCSLDPTAPLPQLVLSIPNVFWKSIELPASCHTTDMNTFEFNEQILCPFNKSMKGKKLSIYFWNNQQGNARFENAKVDILY
ncbi:MAG: acyltransferase [Bacteroidales bacterium]|nr:acyltransferase [Bacteroidales bacterium]